MQPACVVVSDEASISMHSELMSLLILGSTTPCAEYAWQHLVLTSACTQSCTYCVTPYRTSHSGTDVAFVR